MKVYIQKQIRDKILDKSFTVLTERISTISLNNPCDTHSLNLTRGRQPKLRPSMSDSSSRIPDSVWCSPSPTLMLNRTLQKKFREDWNFLMQQWVKKWNEGKYFIDLLLLTDRFYQDDFGD